jgi:ribonuclease HII
LWDSGASVVAGIDEVGRGALAGPVSVGVVAVSRCDAWPEGLADSKELPVVKREAIAGALAEFGVARAVGHASPAEIDARGIVGALRLAALRALASIAAAGVAPDAILLDGRHDWLSPPALDLFGAGTGFGELEDDPAPASAPVTMVVKGDGLCASIAAASVIAKVERDAIMRAAHAEHPHYGWEGNKGYGAAEHLEAIRSLGPTAMHRVSWKLPATSACRVPE